MTAHDADGHGGHDGPGSTGRPGPRRALSIALGANAGFLLVEIAGGLAFNSLALPADAAHMASDVVGLTIALVAQSLVGRPATSRHSFGMKRAEVLGAQGNGLILVAAPAWIPF